MSRRRGALRDPLLSVAVPVCHERAAIEEETIGRVLAVPLRVQLIGVELQLDGYEEGKTITWRDGLVCSGCC
jgi:hypothetical protein